MLLPFFIVKKQKGLMKKQKSPPFVMLPRDMLRSEKWQALSRAAMIVYIYIKQGFNGSNNGNISLKYAEYKWLFAPGTLSKALKELESKEWIEKTKHGGLYRYYCTYKLTGKHDTSVRGKGWQNLYKSSFGEVPARKGFCVDMVKNEVLQPVKGP